MKVLSNLNLTILLSTFVVFPICNSSGNINSTATATYTETILNRFAGGANNNGIVWVDTLYSFAGGIDGANPTTKLIQASDGNFYGTTSGGGSYNNGTVFKLTPQRVETVLYSFSGYDGLTPNGLIQGSDGNFYGTTKVGGFGDCTYGCGTVFKITPQGVETVLHSFADGYDGLTPNGLIQGSDGNFYGTTVGGGFGYGTVFKITPQGVKTIIHCFIGGNDGVNPQAGLVQGSDGNFYGTTSGGGFGYGTVFEITPQGAKTVLYRFAGAPADGANPQSALIQATDGNFYGTTGAGDSSGNGTIFKVTPQGQETVLYSFAGGHDGAYSTGLVQATDGNFYGTTYPGGRDGGQIFKITAQGVETVLSNFYGDENPSGGLILGSDGNLYGTTYQGGTTNHGTVYTLWNSM